MIVTEEDYIGDPEVSQEPIRFSGRFAYDNVNNFYVWWVTDQYGNRYMQGVEDDMIDARSSSYYAAKRYFETYSWYTNPLNLYKDLMVGGGFHLPNDPYQYV